MPPSGLQIVLGPQIMLEAERPFSSQEYREQPSSTIWSPGTIWGPASARFVGGSIFTFFYWMETSQMKSKTRIGKMRLLVGLIEKVWKLFIKHFFEKNRWNAGVAKNKGLLVVIRVQLWSHGLGGPCLPAWPCLAYPAWPCLGFPAWPCLGIH